MAFYLTPMTQLEAVNIVLSSAGEPPVNAVEGSGIDAQNANYLIDEVNRTMQIKGWYWNKENHTLSPNVDGKIVLPGNAAKVDSTQYNATLNVVQRGGFLYNIEDNTYIFENPVQLELVVLLTFDELPQAAKDFIAANAAMLFQQRFLSSDTLDSNLKLRAAQAWAELVRDEVKVADPNMLRDNWSTLSIVQRGWFRRGAFQSGVR